MEFEFDDAQALWEDPDYLEMPARTQSEKPWLDIGRIERVRYSAVITHPQRAGQADFGTSNTEGRRAVV